MEVISPSHMELKKEKVDPLRKTRSALVAFCHAFQEKAMQICTPITLR